MYSYSEIFDDIVSIMQEDSSTCKNMGDGPFEKYKAEITDSMPRLGIRHRARVGLIVERGRWAKEFQ